MSRLSLHQATVLFDFEYSGQNANLYQLTSVLYNSTPT